MLEENVLTAWSVYLLGVAGIMLVFWKITQCVKWPGLRRQLFIIALVLLVYPFNVGDGYSNLAPAMLMLFMETVFEGGEAFNRVGPSLLASTVGVIILLALVEIGVYFWRKKHPQSPLEEHKNDAAEDELLIGKP